ncbi:extracellular solute-binding protein [Tessaracoccus coleopterorum]|uniref:extracellular solute-binding protein n=1 Tax=Tessaracoccus coleopterorum TaxID=2714950 RepID=UPI001E3EE56B|nr:extracellular solute-binding protein [Tessaracoccus coleopterorum]
MNPAPLRVVVVGAGTWGRQHARIFSRRADTELVGIVGRTPDRTAARAAEFGVRAYTDLDVMLREAAPDLVTVCLPNEGHYEATRHLIQAGVPLLVEKPLVFDLAEADDLITLAEEKDLFFAINFNHRWAEPVRRAKAAIEAGELGDIVFATWRFGGEANHGTSPHANLIETQCHGFDMLEHLVGPVESVMAEMTDMTYGDMSSVALALRFESRAVGTMLGSYDSSYAYPDSQLVEINGTAGRLAIHDTVASLEISTAGNEERRVWQAGYFNDEARGFHQTFDRHVDLVLDALRGGDSHRFTPGRAAGPCSWPMPPSDPSNKAAASVWTRCVPDPSGSIPLSRFNHHHSTRRTKMTSSTRLSRRDIFRLSGAAAGTAAFGGMLTACGSSTPVGTSSASSSAGAAVPPGDLSYMFWGSVAEQKATETMLKNFEKEKAGRKIKSLYTPSDYPTKLNALVASNKMPDMVAVEPAMGYRLSGQGKAVNIADYFDKYPALADRLPGSYYYWEEGKCFGTQSANETMILFTNKKAFKEAGIDEAPSVPTQPGSGMTTSRPRTN